VIGRLKDHGPASYQFRRDEDPSYYVRLLTSRGERTLWGKDLERALRDGETRPKPGDLIGARRIGRDAVTVTARERDAEGRVIAQEEHHAHRTRWVVEKVTFFAERVRAPLDLPECTRRGGVRGAADRGPQGSRAVPRAGAGGDRELDPEGRAPSIGLASRLPGTQDARHLDDGGSQARGPRAVNDVISDDPAVEELMSDDSASDWLKAALRTALERDPVDALNDALALAAALEGRLRSVLGLEEED